MAFRFIDYDKFDSLVKSADNILTGIDYLRVVLDVNIDFLDDVSSKLDFDNSNFYIYEDYLTFVKVPLKDGTALLCSVSYNWIPIPIFVYVDFYFANKELFKSFWRLDLYGSYFRLLELWYIQPDFIKELFKEEYKKIEESRITRLDYKIDFFYNRSKKIPEIKDFVKFVKKRKNWKLNENWWLKFEEYRVWKNIISWSYGSRWSKRVFLRVYNKLIDVEKKWKMGLYKDYLDYKKVIRVEFELLNHFCAWYTYKTQHYLVQKFWDNLRSKEIWKIYEGWKNKKWIIKNKIKYFNDFWLRGKNIALSWFNPFMILYKDLKSDNRTAELADILYDEFIKKW